LFYMPPLPPAPSPVVASVVAVSDEQRPSGQACFELWVQRLAAVGEFNEETVETYTAFWSGWTAWLAGVQRHWLDVDAELIERFIQGPAPSDRTPRPPIWSDRMALYTRQRYWRILRGVYGVAVDQGWLDHNPLLDVDERKRPTVPVHTRRPQILPPGVLAQLRQADVLCRVFFPRAADGEGDGWQWRDRAALAVLVHTGITTSELMALRGSHVSLPTSEDEGAYLDVPHDQDLLGRRLFLDNEVLLVLKPWLTVRERLLQHRLAPKKRGPRADPEELAAACRDAPLFMSRQRREGEPWLPALDPSSVYLLVKRALERLFDQAQGSLPDPKLSGLKLASGAAIVRNSVLQDWLITYGLEETALRGGFKTVESLRLLLMGLPNTNHSRES
jgi:site-specific recombinase XerD